MNTDSICDREVREIHSIGRIFSFFFFLVNKSFLSSTFLHLCRGTAKMRLSVACRSCRLRTTKCAHSGMTLYHACKKRGKEFICQLHSTQEPRKISRANTKLWGKTNTVDTQWADILIESSMECAPHRNPELIFFISEIPKTCWKVESNGYSCMCVLSTIHFIHHSRW